jgi:hypothetical protein
VCCAFPLCWWAYGRFPTNKPAETENDPTADSEGREKRAAASILTGGAQNGKGLAGAVGNAVALL